MDASDAPEEVSPVSVLSCASLIPVIVSRSETNIYKLSQISPIVIPSLRPPPPPIQRIRVGDGRTAN